ncbi:MAG: hypothetical protein DCC55_41170 [Chloroflexi bacterium]|nr:MAG: hypothetical protein DCC55_41170 [Chloroflexota bacterium]
MNGRRCSNQSSFHQGLAVGLVIGLLLLTGPGLVQANGGTIVLVEKVGAYDLTVTASPYPLQVGVNDVSVVLARLSDAQVVLDAQVTITAEPLDQPDEPQPFPATHDNATNKLYYAANVVFPTTGRWKLTVQVDGPEGSANTAFETQVEEQQFWGLLDYVNLVALPLIVIALLFFIASRRTWKDLGNELEQEA